jgi:hypothetical protein
MDSLIDFELLFSQLYDLLVVSSIIGGISYVGNKIYRRIFKSLVS